MRQIIDSNDISSLFESTRRDAQAILPQLLRRLIFASCEDGELPDFVMPAGDDVRVHGWDGRLTFTGVHPYIPTGVSAWEMGVSADPEKKADDDYTKRTANPRGVDPASSTFAFVTPHVWAGRAKWIEDQRTKGDWLGVTAIDGTILAQWLERVPGVALWVADALGRPIQGLQSLQRYWDSALSNRYSTRVCPELIIGGRETAQSTLTEWLQSPNGDISLVGETIEEAVAFAIATCKQLESDGTSHEQLSRLLILSDSTATEHLATLSQDHVVLLTDSELYPAVRSEALSHLHFVIPEKRDSRINSTKSSIDIGDIGREQVVQALVAMDVPEEEARQVAVESKGSLHAVLWMIAQPERGSLDWATGSAASELAPLVLAGQWFIAEHPDHEVIEQLSQRPYQEVKQTLSEWSGPGNPIERRGAVWDWKAWGFAWKRLAPALGADDIERFLKLAQEVLGAVDPALDLPHEDRWLAGIRGKVHRHSTALREGLAQSLVLLAVNGEVVHGVNGQAVVNGFVCSLLQVADPAKRWISIARWLPDLAEASPDEFLDALEKLASDAQATQELFTEGGMFGSSPHTYVLWALERLAWSKDHFGRVILILGQLDSLDPGGQLANRPARSLRMIMLPWYPSTGAPVSDRIDALGLLFEHHSESAWKCAASLLPQPHDVGDSFVRPHWREWARNIQPRATHAEYWSFQEQLVDLLLRHVGVSGVRWKDLLEASPQLSSKHPDLAQKIIEAIASLDPDTLAREDAFVLGDAARTLVMHHENMHDADWSLKDEALESFKRLRDHLAPSVLRDRHRWLFTQWPEILREYDLSMEERSEKLADLREAAVAEVLVDEDFNAVRRWGDEVELPESVGHTLATRGLTPDEERDLLQHCFSSVGTLGDRPSAARLGYGYVAKKASTANAAWRDTTAESVFNEFGAEPTALFVLALAPTRETWDYLETLDATVHEVYWREMWVNVLSLDDCEVAVPRLLAANRPFKAIDLVAMLVHGLRRDEGEEADLQRIEQLARAVLDADIDHLPSEERAAAQSTQYELEQLLTFLEGWEASQQELAHWEWKWLPFIADGRRGLKALQAELGNDPELFVELLKFLYRPSDQDPDAPEEPDPQAEARANLAFRLLDAWKQVPGLEEGARSTREAPLDDGLRPIRPASTGTVDEEKLAEWVQRATELATDAKRIEMCHQTIGRQFAYAPADPDGTWPCSPVRKIIESLRNDDVEEGMRCGVMNRRGVYSAGRDGAQEKRMATQFREWCEAIRLEHPRTGTILRRLAEHYEDEARREAERGRLEEFG